MTNKSVFQAIESLKCAHKSIFDAFESKIDNVDFHFIRSNQPDYYYVDIEGEPWIMKYSFKDRTLIMRWGTGHNAATIFFASKEQNNEILSLCRQGNLKGVFDLLKEYCCLYY